MIIHQVVQDRSRLYNVCLLLRQIIKDYETTQVISVYMCIQRIYNPDFFFLYKNFIYNRRRAFSCIK